MSGDLWPRHSQHVQTRPAVCLGTANDSSRCCYLRQYECFRRLAFFPRRSVLTDQMIIGVLPDGDGFVQSTQRIVRRRLVRVGHIWFPERTPSVRSISFSWAIIGRRQAMSERGLFDCVRSRGDDLADRVTHREATVPSVVDLHRVVQMMPTIFRLTEKNVVDASLRYVRPRHRLGYVFTNPFEALLVAGQICIICIFTCCPKIRSGVLCPTSLLVVPKFD